MNISHPGEIAALATAVCWTVTVLAFESAGKKVGSLSVNLIRLVLGFLFLCVYTQWSRGMALPLDATGTAWFWLALSGLVGFVIGDLSLFRAFVTIGGRLSMLVYATVPVFTALLGWLILGEKLEALDWLGMAMTVTGVAWVVLERRKDTEDGDGGLWQIAASPSGLLLALVGAMGQAGGLVLSKLGMQQYDPFAATQIRVLAGIIGFGVLFCAIGWWPKVWSALFNRPAMARIGLGAFFGPFLGVSLSLVAIQLTDAGVVATIIALTPVLIIPPSVLLLGEKVSLRAVLGASLAVGGVSMLFL